MKTIELDKNIVFLVGNMSCSDLDTLRTIIMVVLVVYIILTVTTFIASIFGCLGTCCAPTVSNIRHRPLISIESNQDR